MWKKLLAVFAVLVIAFVAFIATRPEDYHVERSISIAAPPSVVYRRVDRLKDGMIAWSPWDKVDPDTKRTYAGPAEGVGSVYEWESEKVGAGKMTILAVEPDRSVKTEVHFLRPFESTAYATVTLTPEGEGTKATWGFDGKNEGFLPKLFSTFIDADAMVGKDFEDGLASLKTLAEEDAKWAAPTEAAPEAAPEGAPTPPDEAKEG